MNSFTLYIGNKKISSWSFRAWLALKTADISFNEMMIPLYEPNSKANILQVSPSGFVPCLHHGALKIPDSLAIAEYIHELHPEAALFPTNPKRRASARSICSEIHSGFMNLRKSFSMNMPHREMKTPSSEVQNDIKRIFEIWRHGKNTDGMNGPYLFGNWSIVDIFFAPIVSRFISYGINNPEFQDYMDAISHPPFY
jgi:glutathione S-transferase